VFELNVESYPNSFNVYDSLAEAYMNAGDSDHAIEFYEKSLAINPGNTNATAMIDKIRSSE
jgi:Tfp pilus assembly protein PilF